MATAVRTGTAPTGRCRSAKSTSLLPELSVLVVTYAARELAIRCLASVEAERASVDLELIVVDNASPDGTAAALRERFPAAEVIDAGANRGFSAANNLAIRRARGEFLLLLNPDTVVTPGALRACVDALRERPDVGMLGCRLVQEDGTLDHACKRGFPTPLSSLYHFTGLTRLRPRDPRFAQYTAGHVGEWDTAEVDAVNGAFMLVRRAAVDAVGPLDEDYWLYMEDLDWCYAFWQAGWKVLYWPGATVVHVKGGSSTKRRSWQANRAFHRGMWLFYAKHYRATRNPLLNAAVFSAIWVKLGVSALRSAAGRRVGSSA